MEDILAKVEKAGGKGPMWSYGKAVCLCLPVHGNDDASKASLHKALEYLAAAHEQFQDWSRPVLLSAGIYDQLGDSEMALKTYQEAIRLGEINPKAVLRTMELLKQQHKFNEANELFAKMEERRMPVSPDLGEAGVEAALCKEITPVPKIGFSNCGASAI